MNPLASHWFRITMALLIVSPVVAFAVALSTGAPFEITVALTLYMSVLVCVILALIAFAGVAARLAGRIARGLRR